MAGRQRLPCEGESELSAVAATSSWLQRRGVPAGEGRSGRKSNPGTRHRRGTVRSGRHLPTKEMAGGVATKTGAEPGEIDRDDLKSRVSQNQSKPGPPWVKQN